MSKPRYDWWGYIKKMMRRYPNCQRQAETNAIDKAISKTMMRPDSKHRLALIKAIYWSNSKCNLAGAAMSLPGVSEATAKRWHKDFILDVAHNMGLLRRAKK